MFRWLIVIFIALLIINAFTPWFRKIGFGRLPGDLNFTLFGREFNLPVTTTIILSHWWLLAPATAGGFLASRPASSTSAAEYRP